MTRYVILILLAVAVAACSSSPIPAITSTQNVGQETIYPTITAQAPTIITMPSETSTLAPTPTPLNKATTTVIPTWPFTPTPSLTPTPQITTRSLDGMSMVFVPAGDFSMGSPAGEGSDEEVPLHKIYLNEFWIDRTEVTNDQYRIFVSSSGHQAPTTCDWGDPTYGDEAMLNHPVVCVSWEDAAAYCKWAGARLPTEAEWEIAARGTERRLYPWGNYFDGSITNFCDVNCTGDDKNTAWNDGYSMTAPVGSYPTAASPYGALDMAGNVWEWVADWFAFYYYKSSPSQNPPGPKSGLYKVLRGGSWWGIEANERTAFRAWNTPEIRDVVTGFRCVVQPLPSP